MQRTPHRCPHCAMPVCICSDMWGPYYLCRDCGWTAEDDDLLLPTPRKRGGNPPLDLPMQKPRGHPPAYAA